MKTNENQKSTNHQPAAQKPFFGATPELAFFTADRAGATPFFQLKTSSSSTLQATSATTDAESISQPVVQQQVEEKDEMIQRKVDGTQAGKTGSSGEAQPNCTGLPDNLKAGIENLSGFSMDDVRVHYNSSNPQQVNALAYAQGTNIHVAPGQEKHLPHEAWHIVQQKQGRVKPTMQTKEISINDDEILEREATDMGELANRLTANLSPSPAQPISRNHTPSNTMQRILQVGQNTIPQNLKAFIQFLNLLCYGKCTFDVNGQGHITITIQESFSEQVPAELQRKITMFSTRLKQVLTAKDIVTIDFVAGSRAIIGDYNLQMIDLGDIQTIIGDTNPQNQGDDPIDAYSNIIHEITEQYYKQAHRFDFEKAHELALERELEVSDYKRISEKVVYSVQNKNGTYTTIKKLVMRHIKTGQQKVATLTIIDSQVVSLKIEPLAEQAEQPHPTLDKKSQEVRFKQSSQPQISSNQPVEKSLVDQFLADMEDVETEEKRNKMEKGGTTQMQRSLSPASAQPPQQKLSPNTDEMPIQRVTGTITGNDEYRTLFCISQGWDTSDAPEFEVDSSVKEKVQAYADSIIDAAYNKAQQMLQHTINAVFYGLVQFEAVDNEKLDLIKLNMEKVLPNVVINRETLNIMLEGFEDIYDCLKSCTFDALNYKTSTAEDTFAYAIPNIKTIHLLPLFYTHHKNERERALTLIHECSHIINASIVHDMATWYNNAYKWEHTANILDQLSEYFLKQEIEKAQKQQLEMVFQ